MQSIARKSAVSVAGLRGANRMISSICIPFNLTSTMKSSSSSFPYSTATASSSSTTAAKGPRPGSPNHPQTSMQLQTFAQSIIKRIPEGDRKIQKFTVWKDELCLYVAREDLLETLAFLRDDASCRFQQLTDMTAVDFPSRPERFELVYILRSIQFNTMIMVKTSASEITPVPSVVGLFEGANWMEREVWDMFGVFISGHPDLRRILTDYGFEGHPLRKDFPLTGYVEVRYDDTKKRVVAEPLELAQAFRMFEYESPWEQVGPGKSVEKLGDIEKKRRADEAAALAAAAAAKAKEVKK